MMSFHFIWKLLGQRQFYYHRHIWIRYNSRIDTTELLMYFSFSVPKIEKSTEKSNFLIFRENIFFPFQFFLLFDFVNQKCFHVWSCINFSAYFSYFYCWNIDLGNGKPYSNVVFLEDSWWCSNSTMNIGLGVSFFSWDLYFIKLFTHCNDLFPKNSRNQIYIFLCTYILTKWFVILPFLKVGIVLYIIRTNTDHWYFLILWCIFLGSGNTVLRVSREHLQLVLYYLRDTDRAIRGFHKLWFAAGIQ